jgi:NodT family efflux transporter outer membrane factor (OMF) lipoprotein
VVFGGLLPTVNGTSSYRRGGSAGGHDQNLFQAGFDAIWEIDVFGGIRRGVESADANILASEDNLRNVQVSLAAEVATDYALLRMYQQQILIAKRNLTSMRHAADITRQRLRAGFVSGLDVANADAQVATTEAIIPLQEAAAQQAMYALSVLLARPPTDLLATLSDTGTLPVPPARIPVGLPSELLRRRPDIRQAENNIHAATANIGVATADLFPKFSLTGDISWQAFDAAKWFNPVSRTWSFGPSVSWALFQGGSVISNINVQKALRDQSFLTYQQTVLSALQDVENALIAFTKEQEHYKALNDAVIANQKAFDISMQLYTQGQTDFLNVLNAERSLFVSEDALIQSQRFIVTDLIALYKALGGGWEEPAPVASQATTTSAPAVAK